jgi:hypothetical protein
VCPSSPRFHVSAKLGVRGKMGNAVSEVDVATSKSKIDRTASLNDHAQRGIDRYDALHNVDMTGIQVVSSSARFPVMNTTSRWAERENGVEGGYVETRLGGGGVVSPGCTCADVRVRRSLRW